jgi:hypothetical protein
LQDLFRRLYWKVWVASGLIAMISGIVKLLHGSMPFLLKCLFIVEVHFIHGVNVRLRDHVQQPDNNPLLIFPEGTCVNNQYTVMFKKVTPSFLDDHTFGHQNCFFIILYILSSACYFHEALLIKMCVSTAL